MRLTEVTGGRFRVVHAARGLLLVACLVGAGCHKGHTLPLTPNLYQATGADPFADVLEVERGPAIIFYATDRKPTEFGEQVAYGSGRSPSLAIGQCTVDIGGDRSWDEVVQDSLDPKRSRSVPVEIVGVDEMIRFPSDVTSFVEIDGQLVDSPDVVADRDIAKEIVVQMLSEHLERCDRKEIFLFVHGINNSFRDPVYRMAQLWHMGGRIGVPVVFAWPSDPELGPLRGYTHDRESGEFAVYHLRQFLLLLASCPDVERIHILAHSRGTDVTLSAIQQVHLLNDLDAAATRRALKLDNLVLAAPDLDLEVALQRFRADRVSLVPSRLTFYSSRHDKAIGIADWLFASVGRLGRLTADLLTPSQIQVQESDTRALDLIDANIKKSGIGHSYFIDNPAVLSDVLLVLRDDLDAGAENGRPMTLREDGFWEITDDYLLGDQ